VNKTIRWDAEPFSLWTYEQRRLFLRMSPEEQREYVIDNLVEYAFKMSQGFSRRLVG
jgi:hypothetical protein